MGTRRQGPRTRTASIELSDSITAAALAMLEESGLQSLTIRAVAARAGVAPMGVYSRFGSKDGLLETLFEAGFAMLHDSIATPPEAGALRRLRLGCLGYRRFGIANPQLYHLMFEQMMVLELRAEALQSARRSFETLVVRVAAAMDAGDLTLTNSTEAAQQVWSAMHGAVSLEIAGVHFSLDREHSFASMLDALFIGLGATRSLVEDSTAAQAPPAGLP